METWNEETVRRGYTRSLRRIQHARPGELMIERQHHHHITKIISCKLYTLAPAALELLNQLKSRGSIIETFPK